MWPVKYRSHPIESHSHSRALPFVDLRSEIPEKRYDGAPEDACLSRLGENGTQSLIMLALAHPAVPGPSCKTYDTIVRYYRQDVPNRWPSTIPSPLSTSVMTSGARCNIVLPGSAPTHRRTRGVINPARSPSLLRPSPVPYTRLSRSNPAA
jgi:hypothetical protein